MQRLSHGDLGEHDRPLSFRRQDQHLGRRLQLGPLLHGLRQRSRVVPGIVKSVRPSGNVIGSSKARSQLLSAILALWLSLLRPPLYLLLRPAHHDTERVIRQRSLQRPRLIPSTLEIADH